MHFFSACSSSPQALGGRCFNNNFLLNAVYSMFVVIYKRLEVLFCGLSDFMPNARLRCLSFPVAVHSCTDIGGVGLMSS